MSYWLEPGQLGVELDFLVSESQLQRLKPIMGLFFFSTREGWRLVRQSCWDNLMISLRTALSLSFCSALLCMFLFSRPHCDIKWLQELQPSHLCSRQAGGRDMKVQGHSVFPEFPVSDFCLCFIGHHWL